MYKFSLWIFLLPLLGATLSWVFCQEPIPLGVKNIVLQTGASCHQGLMDDALEKSKAFPVRIFIVNIQSTLPCVILSKAQETKVVISNQQLWSKPQRVGP
jgi:hypothetical protein